MSKSIDIDSLYEKNKTEIISYIKRVEKEKAAAIPFIVSRITFYVVPTMMRDLSNVKTMSGPKKKQLLIDAVIYSIDTLFEELNTSTYLSQETWDEHVRDLLLGTLPIAIDTFIDAEKGKLQINTRQWTCCGKVEE